MSFGEINKWLRWFLAFAALAFAALIGSGAVWASDFAAKMEGLKQVRLQPMIDSGLVQRQGSQVYTLGAVGEHTKLRLEFAKQIAQLLNLNVVLFGEFTTDKMEARAMGFDGILFDQLGLPQWNFSLRMRRSHRSNVLLQLREIENEAIKKIRSLAKHGWDSSSELFASKRIGDAYYKLLFDQGSRAFCVISDLSGTGQDVKLTGVMRSDGRVQDMVLSTSADGPGGVIRYALDHENLPFSSRVLVFSNIALVHHTEERAGHWVHTNPPQATTCRENPFKDQLPAQQ